MKIEEKSLTELTQERYKLLKDIEKLKRKLRKKENDLEYVKNQIQIEISLENEDNDTWSVVEASDLLISQICKVFHDI